MNTTATPVSSPPAGPLWLRVVKRILIVAIVATVFTLVLDTSSESATSEKPAGFFKGMLHGAMMPGAMPHLLFGHDVTIYALNNTGRTYKLGYTAGVNGCGAIFFGILYWRFNAWRKKRRAEGKDTP